MHAELVQQLKEILGPAGWTGPEDCEPFVTDLQGRGETCLLVARPADTQQVSQVVAACAHFGVAVIPQGGNTNVCHMAVPLKGQQAVIVSLARMNRIIEVNPDRSTITAEAGCLMQSLQDAASEHGMTFSPDWGARGSAMVGGAVATNGGGLNVVRYGTTREQVLGMEVVLPDGTVWNGMRALVKDNSGYDLKQLFIGSEGTLGIITRLVFKLHPEQPEAQSMMAVLSEMPCLMEFFALARSIGGEKLTAFELLPGLGVEKALERYPDLRRPLETRADWYVLVRFAGRDSVETDLMALFEQGFESGVLEDAVLSQSVGQERNLWEIREQMIPHQYFSERMLKWDVSVPIDRIVEFLETAHETVTSIQDTAITYAVGHVGDGNVHYSVFPMGEESAEIDVICDEIYEKIDALIWRLGGSVVAEHGVGSLFVDRVCRQKSDVEYAMMLKLKQMFDPHGVMNPRKLLRDRL